MRQSTIVLGKVDITTETNLSNRFGVSHFVNILNDFCFIPLDFILVSPPPNNFWQTWFSGGCYYVPDPLVQNLQDTFTPNP